MATPPTSEQLTTYISETKEENRSNEAAGDTSIALSVHDHTNDIDYGQHDQYAEANVERMLKAAKVLNNNYHQLESKYGYILGRGNGCCNCIYKFWDKIGGLLVFLLLLLPMLLLWFLIIIFLYIFYFLFCQFNSISFSDYIILFIGKQRIKLLQNEKKNSCCYHIFNRIIGFAQLLDFIKNIIKNSFYESNLRWHRIFGNGDAYPYLFSIVTTRYDDIHELIHKPEWTSDPTHTAAAAGAGLKIRASAKRISKRIAAIQNDAVFHDREAKTFYTFELSKEIGWYGTGHVFSIADGRHTMMRDIQYICLNIKKCEYYDLETYHKEKYDPLMSKLPDDAEKWLAKYLKYPYCKKNYFPLHYAVLMWRLFGIKLTEPEMDMICKSAKAFAFLPMPNWFHLLLFKNAMLRNVYIAINRIADIIESRCQNGILEKLYSYADKYDIERRQVLYSASLMFWFAGGNKVFGEIINRFEKNAKYEYKIFKLNPSKYILEMIRLHASIVRATSSISHKDYIFRINNKDLLFPVGTMIGASLTSINDNISSSYSDKFMFDRKDKDYGKCVSWNLKDGYFSGHSGKHLLNARFCPGKAIALKHLTQMCQLLVETTLVKQFKLGGRDDDGESGFIDTTEIHESLSLYNQIVVSALVPGIAKHNSDSNNDYLPEIMIDEQDMRKSVKKMKTTKLFGRELLDEDLYVSRAKVKDTVFDIITHVPFIFPVEDDSTPFDKRDINLSKQKAKLYLKEKCVMPQANVLWKNCKSDYEMSLLAFGGLICNYTKLINNNNFSESKDNDENDEKRRKIRIPIPSDAVYKSDLTWLYDFEVRKSLHRYGACAYFDKNCQLISIYVSHLESMVFKGSPKMAYAKYVWITSAFTALTLKEHAMDTHMTEANALVTNTYKHLPLNHYLRRLLSIFTYRSVYINQSMHKVLLAKNGLVHRIWGFTYKSVSKISEIALNTYQYIPYTERFDRNLSNLDDSIFPINKDSNEFYDIMHNFLFDYVSNYDVNNDEYCKLFYQALCNDLKIDMNNNNGGNNEFNKENFIHLLTNLICVVTAYHEQVGSVADNICADIDWCGTKLYKHSKDKCQSGKNDFVATALLIMLTGVRNPKLIGNFTHILDKQDKNYDKNVKIFESWQNNLKMLEANIDERNKTRRIDFNCINPRYLECSVSI